ncbi:MAG: STAS domain-containing protein [Dehalococcoidia bacterium]
MNESTRDAAGQAKLNDEITEEEFDALLDARPRAVQSATAMPAQPAPTTGAELITEGEFDAILERLATNRPGATAVAAGAAVTNTLPQASATNSLLLPAEISIADARGLYGRLRALGEGDVVLDARKVERVDTAILQLLLAFMRKVEGRGDTCSLCHASDALEATARRLGLEGALGLSISLGG